MFNLKAGNIIGIAALTGRGRLSGRKTVNEDEADASAAASSQTFLHFLSTQGEPGRNAKTEPQHISAPHIFESPAREQAPKSSPVQRPLPLKDARVHATPRNETPVVKRLSFESAEPRDPPTSTTASHDGAPNEPDVPAQPYVSFAPETSPTAAIVQLPPPIQSVAEQISDAVQAAAPVTDAKPDETPVRKLEIALRPQHLGTVHVTLRLRGKMLDVQVVTQSSEAADVLTHDRAMLVTLLGRFSDQQAVSVTITAQPQTAQEFSMPSGGQGHSTNHPPAQGKNTEHVHEAREDSQNSAAVDDDRNGVYL